jgi:signal peptidase II
VDEAGHVSMAGFAQARQRVVVVETALNYGALFGMGQNMGWLFATLSVLALAGILYWLFVAKAARDWLLTIALAGVTAGILGNLYDRLGLWANPTGSPIYAVRDWILFRYGQHTWPNFNIADSLLVCGAGLLIWHAWKFQGEADSAAGSSVVHSQESPSK